MRKKLTLWGALCLIMVCMIQMTVSAATTVTISQCIISGANQVTVTASASATTPSDDNNYYLFALQPYENAIGARTDFCAQTAKAAALTFVTTLDQGTAASKLYAKFVVAVKTGGKYVAVSPEFYITNPEAVATKTAANPVTTSIKGVTADNAAILDLAALGVQHASYEIAIDRFFEPSVTVI